MPGWLIFLVVLAVVSGIACACFGIWFWHWHFRAVMDYRHRVKHGVRVRRRCDSEYSESPSGGAYSSRLAELAAQMKAEDEKKNQGN